MADASGNSRGLLSGSNVNTDGYNWDAFGTLVSRAGSNPTMFGWNEASGYQSDNDDGLTLLGHRYYDKRIGRFITQDPAGDGTNWYGYAGNDPTNNTDPTGLFEDLPPLFQDPSQSGTTYDSGNDGMSQFLNGDAGEYNRYNSNGSYKGSFWSGATAWDNMNSPTGGGSPGAGIADKSSQSHETPWKWIWRLMKSGGMAGNHNYHEIPINFSHLPILSAGPGKGPGNKPDDTVEEILKGKYASIKQAPLEPGSPTWQNVNKMQWKEILKGAEEGKPGYGTFKKLLNDGWFNRR